MINWFMSHIAAVASPRPPERVEFDDSGVSRHLSSGATERVSWENLQEVGIITTSDGPMMEDVYWMLVGPGGEQGCAIPGGLMQEGLLTRLQALPGFDSMVVIEAMGCASDASFTCWRRSPN